MKNGTWLIVDGKRVAGVPQYDERGKVIGHKPQLPDKPKEKRKPATAAGKE